MGLCVKGLVTCCLPGTPMKYCKEVSICACFHCMTHFSLFNFNEMAIMIVMIVMMVMIVMIVMIICKFPLGKTC